MKREAAEPAVRLRILLLEDDAEDADLVLRELRRAGVEVEATLVGTRAEFEAQLDARPDAILSDYHLPAWDGLQALRLVRERGLETPFILVSGLIGEDVAVEAMRHGADDYLLKDRLGRLGAALRQALERKRLREEARSNEQVVALEHAVARHLAGADSMAAGLQAVLRLVCESEGWQVGRYWGVDEAAGVLRFNQLWSVPGVDGVDVAEEVSRDVVFERGAGLAGRVWQSGQALWIPDVTRDERVKRVDMARASGTRGAFLFPVVSDGATVGVLTFTTSEIREPDARLYAAVGVIGGQIGQFLRRKQGEDRIRRLNRVYAVLSGINTAIVRIREHDELFREICRIAVSEGGFIVARALDVDVAGQIRIAATSEADPRLFQRIVDEYNSDPEHSQSLLALGMRGGGTPLVSNDVAGDPRIPNRAALTKEGNYALALLPIVVEKRIAGMIILRSREAGMFDEDEMRLLLELVSNLSFALELMDKQKKLDYLAYYDVLTGLANRNLFQERLTQHLRAGKRGQVKLALALVNIERFKMINDSLGRQAGDELLEQLAGRLAQAADRESVARIGGDHFAIVVPEVKGRSEIGRNVERIWRECFSQPFTLNGTELRVSARAGIALYPSDGRDAETLFASAEAALQKAQETGERLQFHARAMTERVADQLALENRLRQALENDEFVLHYQPKVDLETRDIVGVEALIRWQSPELGLVPPMKFIPLMEETGMILQAGTWALKRASLDHRKWVEQGLAAPRVAVNVSPIQLRQRDFVAAVQAAIAEGIAPTGIDLEITESLIMEDVQGSIEKLKAVRALGVNIAIDDFGTGYSSLGYLAKLPVQSLKIDRSFIVTMLNDPDTMTLVSTIVSLAHSLRRKVVAEGVDEEEQAKMLRLLRCDELQGYLFSKPLPFEAMTALLRQGKKS